MWWNSRKRSDDYVQEWLVNLREKFGLSEKEAKELHKHMRTCFAHGYGETAVKEVIYNYLSNLNRKLDENSIEVNSVFTYRAGSRRYSKWSWQESAFGVLAYILTIIFFSFEIIFSPEQIQGASAYQFLTVVLVFILWLLFDRCLRARPATINIFNAVNRFMPGFTLVAYLSFHLCKMMFFACGKEWIFGMKIVVVAYVVLGAWRTISLLRQFRKVEALKKQ